MKLDLDLDALGLTETDVIDTFRRALAATISTAVAAGHEIPTDEQALLDALPKSEAGPRPATDEDLAKWVGKVHDMREVERRKRFPNLDPVPLTIEKGRKYARIVCNHSNQRLVYCFIQLDNGDILKSESWRKRAKYARGNIFAADPLGGVGVYGAAYLR
jgi:hypothetical protein